MKVKHFAESRITIAMTEGNIPNTVNVGFAVANPRDQFVRKNGYAIATGRAAKNPFTIVGDLKGMRYKDICQGLVDAIDILPSVERMHYSGLKRALVNAMKTL